MVHRQISLRQSRLKKIESSQLIAEGTKSVKILLVNNHPRFVIIYFNEKNVLYCSQVITKGAL